MDGGDLVTGRAALSEVQEQKRGPEEQREQQGRNQAERYRVEYIIGRRFWYEP